MKKFLLCIGLAGTFVGADCSTPTGLTRSCPGATVQSLKYSVTGSCGGAGVIEVSVANAGQCTITVVEPTGGPEGLSLPTTGSFSDSAGATSYDLSKGNWGLQPPPTGMIGDNAGLQCTAATASGGDIALGCNITECIETGDDMEPTCMITGSCTMHLVPASLDAAIVSPTVDATTADASMAQADAGGARADGGTTKDASPGQ